MHDTIASSCSCRQEACGQFSVYTQLADIGDGPSGEVAERSKSTTAVLLPAANAPDLKIKMLSARRMKATRRCVPGSPIL